MGGGTIRSPPALAAELVALKVDLLVTYSNPGVHLQLSSQLQAFPLVIAISGEALRPQPQATRRQRHGTDLR
jgi:hypothetical protein